MFSFYLTHLKDEERLGQSHLDIGFIDYDLLASEVTWIEAKKNEYFWTSYIEGISFTAPGEHVYESDDVGEVNAWSTGRLDAVTDSGTSCVYAPSKVRDFLLKELLKDTFDPVFDSYWGYIV